MVAAIVIDSPNDPPELKGNIQEIQHGNEGNATEEHRKGTEDPHKEREREVEGTKSQGPKIAASVHGVGHIFGREMVVVLLMVGHLFYRHVDEDACMAVIPDGL
ncbi:hypothetical protein V6N13_130552 [Hibiscus sabdariffa]